MLFRTRRGDGGDGGTGGKVIDAKGDSIPPVSVPQSPRPKLEAEAVLKAAQVI